VFNKALLSKQIWRILQFSDSLVAKILKAKYHPSCSILDANIGNRPSYVWRSFMIAQPVLQNGLLWRIGSGKDIKIWRDKWIPKPLTYRVQSPRVILDSQACVAELIDHDLRKWKEDLISEIFVQDEAKLIQSIPLSPFPAEDHITWSGTKNGIFSMRSAYFLEMENLASKHGSSSRSDTGKEWKECWRLNVPNTVKLFLWKALHNLLPTRVNLAKRGVIKDTSYPICGLEEEFVAHILWNCPSSKDVWGGGPIRLQKMGGVNGCFASVLDAVLGRCNQEEIELFAVTARRIWLRRNSLIHGEKFAHPTQLARDAQNAFEEFQKVNCMAQHDEPNDKDVMIIQWRPPPRDMIKLNWDAKANAKEGRVGLGLIARDAQGICLVAQSMSLEVLADAAMAETLATANAVIFCKELGYTNVIFEGDAMQVIKAIEMNGQCMSSYGHMIECIREELRNLENASFTHVRREANNAAHTLAKLATTHVTLSTWRGMSHQVSMIL
jgi:ribonuclease HI